VVAEMLSIGPFTHGDTRRYPPLPDDDDFLLMNWQNWRWNDLYLPTYDKIAAGDAEFTAQTAQQKAAALKLADESLANLESARPHLPDIEYDILHTRLLTNKTQMAIRGPMVLATLQYLAMRRTWESDKREALSQAMLENIEKIRAVAATLDDEWPDGVEYRGKTWYLGEPENLGREQLYRWAYNADLCRLGKHYSPQPRRLQPPRSRSSD
jgi:hypothetical protein